MDFDNFDDIISQDVHLASSFDEEMSGNFDYPYYEMTPEIDLNEPENSYFLCPEIQPTYYYEDAGRNPSPPLLPESPTYAQLIPVQGNYESFSFHDNETEKQYGEPDISRLPSFDETYHSPSVLSSQLSLNENNLQVTSVYDLSSLQTLNISDIAEQNNSNDSILQEILSSKPQAPNPKSCSLYESHSYESRSNSRENILDTNSRENILDNSFATSPNYASSPSWYEQSEDSYGDEKFPPIEHATPPMAIPQGILDNENDTMIQEDGTSDWLKEIRETKNARPRGPKCWEFLLRLLMDSRSNPSLIRWEDQSQGVFRLVNKDKISAIWGSRPCKKKKEEGIKYDSFARNLRYHYKSGKGKVRSVSEKHLVYKFPKEVMDLFSNKRIR